MAITEHTINDALAEIISGTRSLWRAKGACQAITPNNSDKCLALRVTALQTSNRTNWLGVLSHYLPVPKRNPRGARGLHVGGLL
jgi:hypothetical protein